VPLVLSEESCPRRSNRAVLETAAIGHADNITPRHTT